METINGRLIVNVVSIHGRGMFVSIDIGVDFSDICSHEEMEIVQTPTTTTKLSYGKRVSGKEPAIHERTCSF